MASTALFFTQSNPPTGAKGQLGIVQHLATKYDSVWVVPLRTSSKERALLDYEHRVNMARLVFEDVSHKVRVQRLDEDLTMVAALRAFKTAEPSREFSLALGFDSYNQLFSEARPTTPIPPATPVPEPVQAEGEGEGDEEPTPSGVAEEGNESASEPSTRAPSSAESKQDETEATDANDAHLSELLMDIQLFARAGHSFPSALDEREMLLCGVGVTSVELPSLGPTSSSSLAASRDPYFLMANCHHSVLRYMERRRLFAFERSTMQSAKPARPIPRNPTLDQTELLRQQAAAASPQALLAGAATVLSRGFQEMLKRDVSQDSLEWLAQHIKNEQQA